MKLSKEYIQKSRLIVFITLGLIFILENIDSVTLPWFFKPLIIILMSIMVILIQLEKKAN
jgi:uncharacterized integral membrane protein